MKAATIPEIRTELSTLPPATLCELCLRLARFKKDNKELLTYLLFEADDEAAYMTHVKKEIDLGFEELPKPNPYLTKKTLRRILRTTTRQIRYAGSPQVEVELLIYFCAKIRDARIPVPPDTVIGNLYRQQIKKIQSILATMHEDLQYDYAKALEEIN